MRKVLALAITAMLMTGIAAAPASAATSKAGTKCAAKLALSKVSGVKYYCGVNTNTKTKKKLPLVWVKSGVCYDGIVEYNKTALQYSTAKTQFAAMQTTYANIDTRTLDAASTTQMQSLGSSLANLKTMLDMLGPVSKQLGENIAELCP